MSLFNNREIATAIWLFVIFIFVISYKNTRESLFAVFKSFFQIKILSSIFLIIVYTGGIVVLLYQINLWNTSLLKDTILWLCFTGIVMFNGFITSRGEQNLFRKAIVDSLKVVIVIEFLINTYTFPLFGELVLILVVSLIVVLEAVAQTDEKYSSVAKLMRGLQIIIGTVILIYAIGNAVSDYKILGSFDTIRSFLLSPLLTILFLPFIYFMLVITTYEVLFIDLNFGYKKSNKIKRYAKREIIKYCRLDLKKVRQASNRRIYNLMQIRNEDDVDKMIRALKSQAL